ncbi:MAG: nicotinate-nucleotide adenylyltransferase [Betaproteobacteria bacterium]|nr:nicotinate-nucleotide adenylyltransferase [Betaproteobacteria bacterium]
MKPVGILGGTFDPVHFAHLRLAHEAFVAADLSQVHFIPAARPPHRETPAVTAAHRLRMVELAVAGDDRFVADDRELRRTTPSYTIDTVGSLRHELGPDAPLCLILGADAFVLFDTWRQWERLLESVHVMVATRPGFAIDPEGAALRAELLARRTQRIADLASTAGGRIFPFVITPMDISGSRIREDLAAGSSPRYLLPDSVLGYIESNRLYRSPDAA